MNNVTLSNNSAELGGSIHGYGNVHITMNNCISWENTPQEIFSENSSVDYPHIDLNHSDIQGGESEIYGSTNYVSWSNSIDTDPLFVNPASSDYHLTKDSPCVDTGDPSSSIDPDGTISDMGVHYFPHLNSNFTADPMFGYENLNVDFTDASESYASHWFWDFESDGIYDDFTQNPSHFYDQPGIYDVTLKIGYDTLALVDSLMKSTLIVIQESQLLPPQNPIISVIGDDVILNWDIVVNANYYLVYLSDNPYGNFEFHDYTTVITTYTDTGIAATANKMFYFVIGFDGTMEELNLFISQNQIMGIGTSTK